MNISKVHSASTPFTNYVYTHKKFTPTSPDTSHARALAPPPHGKKLCAKKRWIYFSHLGIINLWSHLLLNWLAVGHLIQPQCWFLQRIRATPMAQRAVKQIFKCELNGERLVSTVITN